MPENVNTSELVLNQEAEPEDNRPVMIKVDHVSMSFNMASEQMNSLKEYAVAIAKRKLFFEEFKALDDVSFEVRKGDVFGIMGTNGSGKSTMLKIIAGVLEPTKGTCQVNGNIAPLIELGAGFDMDLSARENIYLNGALLGYSKQFIDENFDAIVEFAEVEKFLDMPLKNYSSGMVARIAFAIATVIVPEILVVDEVLSVGDFMFQKKCEDRIIELIERHGVTVLIVSHSNEQIARLCNRAIWVEKGHERLQGAAEYVCRIYAGLGGRTGSPESEQIVFDHMKNASAHEDRAVRMIVGDDASAVSAHAMEAAWENSAASTAVIVADSTHANAIVANALAGAMDAPILPTKGDRLSESVLLFLTNKKPSTIFYLDCGWHSPSAFDQVKALPWAPSVEYFGKDQSLFDFCSSVYRYGKDRQFWGARAALIGFEDNVQSLAAAPMLCRGKLPAFIFFERADAECVFGYAAEQGIHFDAIGPYAARVMTGSGCEPPFKEIGAGAAVWDSCADIAGEEMRSFQSKSLTVASASLAQWPDLVSAGCYATKVDSPLVLIDPTNLDSIAGTLLLMSRCEVDRLTFFRGQAGLTDAEIGILSSSMSAL